VPARPCFEFEAKDHSGAQGDGIGGGGEQGATKASRPHRRRPSKRSRGGDRPEHAAAPGSGTGALVAAGSRQAAAGAVIEHQRPDRLIIPRPVAACSASTPPDVARTGCQTTRLSRARLSRATHAAAEQASHHDQAIQRCRRSRGLELGEVAGPSKQWQVPHSRRPGIRTRAASH